MRYSFLILERPHHIQDNHLETNHGNRCNLPASKEDLNNPNVVPGSIVVTASFQNVLNHVNLGEPLSSSQSYLTVTTANAGKITSTHVFPPAGSPRSGMLGLRWRF